MYVMLSRVDEMASNSFHRSLVTAFAYLYFSKNRLIPIRNSSSPIKFSNILVKNKKHVKKDSEFFYIFLLDIEMLSKNNKSMIPQNRSSFAVCNCIKNFCNLIRILYRLNYRMRINSCVQIHNTM